MALSEAKLPFLDADEGQDNGVAGFALTTMTSAHASARVLILDWHAHRHATLASLRFSTRAKWLVNMYFMCKVCVAGPESGCVSLLQHQRDLDEVIRRESRKPVDIVDVAFFLAFTASTCGRVVCCVCRFELVRKYFLNSVYEV